MNFEVIFTNFAQKCLIQILHNIEENWSKSVKDKFISNMDDILEILKSQPFIYQETLKFPGIRRCILSKNNSMYYKVIENNIFILMLVDNRQNQKIISELLKNNI